MNLFLYKFYIVYISALSSIELVIVRYTASIILIDYKCSTFFATVRPKARRSFSQFLVCSLLLPPHK